MKFDGKVVLITGGGTGIGKSAALALAREGAKVVIVGRRSGPLEETAQEIKAINGEVLAVPTGVTKVGVRESPRERKASLWGGCIFNKNGRGVGGPTLKIKTEEGNLKKKIKLRCGLDVTFIKIIPLLGKGGRGSIIKIGGGEFQYILYPRGIWRKEFYCLLCHEGWGSEPNSGHGHRLRSPDKSKLPMSIAYCHSYDAAGN